MTALTAAWFCALGETLNEGERETLGTYLAGVGYAEVRIQAVESWHQARALINDPHWDQTLWQREQAIRGELIKHSKLAERSDTLNTEFEMISDTLHGCAAISAARMQCSDAGLIRAAAGAATEAVYLASLASDAGENLQHPFACKLALFESGHWPLVMVHNTYYIF